MDASLEKVWRGAPVPGWWGRGRPGAPAGGAVAEARRALRGERAPAVVPLAGRWAAPRGRGGGAGVSGGPGLGAAFPQRLGLRGGGLCLTGLSQLRLTEP